MKIKFILPIVILVLIGIVGAVSLYTQKVPTLEGSKPDMVVTASQLFADFDADESVALTKYNGKILQVSGVVSSIVQKGGLTNLILKTDSPFGGVNCQFTKKIKIEKGSKVEVKGLCQGFLMDVVLNNCNLIL